MLFVPCATSVGTAELDVLLVSPEGETVRTSAIVFEITRGITK